MKLKINQDRMTADIKLGSVVYFPRYGTSYIVHVADKSAIMQRKKHEHLQDQSLVMLARLDGLRPYQIEPFTQQELKEKINWLQAEVYSPDRYVLQLAVKKN